MDLITQLAWDAYSVVYVVVDFIVNDIGIAPILVLAAVFIAGGFQIMIDRERHPDDIFRRHDNIAKRHRKALVRDLAREIQRQDHTDRSSPSE